MKKRWLRFRELFRLWLAYRLEKATPDRFCWADLVMWAMYDGHTLAEARRGGDRCRAEKYGRDECCYCGKFGDMPWHRGEEDDAWGEEVKA